MSVQKWNQLAEEKSAVEQQTQDIHQKFRMNKISKEFGQLSGEELFKPITKRLEKSSTTAQEEEEESPDYAMDEFDRTNPSGEEFRLDAPTPAPTPPPTPPPPPFQYDDDDGGDFPQPPPSLEETSTRKEWGMPGPVEPEYPHESSCCKRSIS